MPDPEPQQFVAAWARLEANPKGNRGERKTLAQAIVRARAQGRCELCGATDPLTFSHRTPKSLGGAWRASNGIRACGSGTIGCHGWIESHPTWAEAAGWRVLPREDPSQIPAFLIAPWPGWWFLTDDGMYVSATNSDRPVPERLPPQTLIRL